MSMDPDMRRMSHQPQLHAGHGVVDRRGAVDRKKGILSEAILAQLPETVLAKVQLIAQPTG